MILTTTHLVVALAAIGVTTSVTLTVSSAFTLVREARAGLFSA